MFQVSTYQPDWKNTLNAEYVHRSSKIAPRILQCVRRNLACTKLGASPSQNYRRTREPRCMWQVKLAQKGQENGQRRKKGQQKLGKFLKKGRQNFEVTKKRSKYSSSAYTINLGQFLVCWLRRSDALSSAHQRWRASGVVDGNFPHWPTNGMPESSDVISYLVCHWSDFSGYFVIL